MGCCAKNGTARASIIRVALPKKGSYALVWMELLLKWDIFFQSVECS